jgi:hypothetical protein
VLSATGHYFSGIKKPPQRFLTLACYGSGTHSKKGLGMVIKRSMKDPEKISGKVRGPEQVSSVLNDC